ncbi:MAG: PQQ-binding-like beta-propeller repeat protein [Proteobacteria bacterium]|nr:PQQ-binding-like beta-propeller repeat protein [Pseudomonadota bacterium]MCP4919236.1 PQQ-binding-like beta-propeller repeat protein [Pseudomonadota bacterium]
MIWLLACTGPSVPPKIVDVVLEEPKVLDVLPVVADLPPADWGTNTWPGPGPVGAPTVVWTYTLGRPVVGQPVTDGEALYVPAGDRVLRVDVDGSIAWSHPIEVVSELRADAIGVWVAEEDRWRQLARDDGREMQSELSAEPPRGAPVLYQDELGWVTRAGTVRSSAGWAVEAGISAVGSPSSDGERLWFATEEGELLALDGQDVAWTGRLRGPGQERPAYDGERLYSVVGPYEETPGAVVGFDLAGQELWRHQLVLRSSGPVAVHPRAGVLVSEAGGRVVALDPVTGSLNWELDVGAAISAPPVLSGDRLYLGSPDGRVFIVDVDDGVAWRGVELDNAVVGGMAVFQGVLTAGLADGRLVGIQ